MWMGNVIGLDEKVIAVMCFGFLINLFTLHACNMLNHLKLIIITNAWCDNSILTMYTIANCMFLRSPSLAYNHHHHCIQCMDLPPNFFGLPQLQFTLAWFLKTTTRFICFTTLSRTHCSQHGLHGVEAAFTLCLPLRFRASLLAFSSSLPSQLLPF